jgi:glycosyltransferase involved in cell wall biosynthesis
MIIGVNAVSLLWESPSSTGNTVSRFLWELCRQRPEQSFVFFFDQQFTYQLPPNAKAVVIPRSSNSVFQRYLWMEWKLPAAVRQHKVGLLINLDGILPMRCKVKQVLLVPDFDFRKKQTPRYLERAGRIIVFSPALGQELLQYAPGLTGKIEVVQPGIDGSYHPFEYAEREAAKKEFCEGVEYFVAVGDLHPNNNILPLLKAYSALKRRLLSNMKLVLVGRETIAGEDIKTALASYKFRSDIVLVDDPDQATLARLVAGAYALVYTNRIDAVASPVYAALRSSVPVVAIEGPAAREAAGDAALYANPEDMSELAEKMSLVYKDEDLRSGMIRRGTERQLPLATFVPEAGLP